MSQMGMGTLALIIGGVFALIGLSVILPVGMQVVTQVNQVTNSGLTGTALTAYNQLYTGIWGGFQLYSISPTIVVAGGIISLIVGAFAFFMYKR